MKIYGKCDWCGKPNCEYKLIGVNETTKRFYCSEDCEMELRHQYYTEKRKSDNRYYSNIPQYDDDDGWGY